MKQIFQLLQLSLIRYPSRLKKNRFFLESRNMATGLERRVQERTRDLQLAIKELGNSRAAALNMMEDAVEAGNELESARSSCKRRSASAGKPRMKSYL